MALSDRNKYPGMLPVEVAIFKAWLAQHENEYDSYDFNVRVGKGLDPGPTFTAEERRAGILNSQKRIDVVAYKDGRPTIIEVKDRAGLSALGELMGYTVLYHVTFREQPIPLLRLVTNSLQPDMREILDAAGVPIDIVTPT